MGIQMNARRSHSQRPTREKINVRTLLKHSIHFPDGPGQNGPRGSALDLKANSRVETLIPFKI